MFYSDSMLTKKGPLANIWLAAHWDRKLTKAQIVQTNINESVNDLINGNLHDMALRLSGQLLLGVSKIYDRKTKYLLEDCSDAVFKITTAFKPGIQVDLPAEQFKAAVSAITLSTSMKMDDLMMPELDLNIEEILKEAAMANQNGKSNTMLAKHDLKKALSMKDVEETGHVGFGPVQDMNEIPGEFDMDIELGRRATDGSLARLSEQLSIEQGRRESGVRLSDNFDAMQFSPLRTPTKDVLGSNNPFDGENQIPMMDDDYGGMMNNQEEDQNPDNFLPSDPINPLGEMSPVADRIEVNETPVKKTPRKRAAKKGVLALDEQTEITNNEMQANLRNNEEICEAEEIQSESVASEFSNTKSVFHLPLFASGLNSSAFEALFKYNKVQPARASARKQHQPEEQVQERSPCQQNDAPMIDDDYGWMGPPMQEDGQADAENQVPDVNSNQADAGLSGLASPMKRLSISQMSQGSQSTFSRSTTDVLEVWKAEFSSTKVKSLDLEADLMQAMAGQGVVTKRVAASAFFEALVLRGKGLIKVRQTTPFSSISVQANAGLFTAISITEQ